MIAVVGTYACHLVYVYGYFLMEYCSFFFLEFSFFSVRQRLDIVVMMRLNWHENSGLNSSVVQHPTPGACGHGITYY